MSTTNNLLETAMDYAERGIPIFPCRPDGKAPACAHGHKDASKDPDQIRAWWTECPEYNIGLCPEDASWCVIDVDPGANLADIPDRPQTYEVRTPRGGAHLYYQGSLPPTASKLGEHIDTRGRNSYVLVPPSIVNGKPYEAINDPSQITTLPPDIATRIADANKPVAATNTELDGSANVARVQSLLSACVSAGDVAIAGQGGNNRTYRLAAEIQALGISQELTLSLLEEHWNPHCQPPWEHDELLALVTNASSYMQNEAGAFAVGSAQEVFGETLETLPEAPAPTRSRFWFEDDAEQDCAPDPEWLIPELIPDRATILVLGLTGSFKSFLVQDIALAITTGKMTFGQAPVRIGPTFYGAHEVRDDIRKARKQAWKVAREIVGQIPFYVARGPHVASREECEEFREQIRVRLRENTQKIGLVVLDTVAKCMVGLNENDASDVGQFIAFVDSIRDEFECPVICLHHFGKDEGRGGRGSSAFQAGFDTTLSVKRQPNTKLVSVRVVQHASAPEREEPFFFEGRAIGQSLVFQPIDAQAFRAVTAGVETFAPKIVGACLRALSAIGVDNGVTTHVLAAALNPPDELDDPEATAAQVERDSRVLTGLSRSKLEAYCTRQSRHLLWHLPA